MVIKIPPNPPLGKGGKNDFLMIRELMKSSTRLMGRAGAALLRYDEGGDGAAGLAPVAGAGGWLAVQPGAQQIRVKRRAG